MLHLETCPLVPPAMSGYSSAKYCITVFSLSFPPGCVEESAGVEEKRKGRREGHEKVRYKKRESDGLVKWKEEGGGLRRKRE